MINISLKIWYNSFNKYLLLMKVNIILKLKKLIDNINNLIINLFL